MLFLGKINYCTNHDTQQCQDRVPQCISHTGPVLVVGPRYLPEIKHHDSKLSVVESSRTAFFHRYKPFTPMVE